MKWTKRVLWMAQLIWGELSVFDKFFLCAMAGASLAALLSGAPQIPLMLFLPAAFLVMNGFSQVTRKEDQRQKDALLDALERCSLELVKHDHTQARAITNDCCKKLISESLLIPPQEREEWLL